MCMGVLHTNCQREGWVGLDEGVPKNLLYFAGASALPPSQPSRWLIFGIKFQTITPTPLPWLLATPAAPTQLLSSPTPSLKLLAALIPPPQLRAASNPPPQLSPALIPSPRLLEIP
jgi:hypothetical protein